MKIRLKAPAGLPGTGIYGADGVEMPVGHEMEVKEEPKGWAGRYDVLSGGDQVGKTAVTNPTGATAGYAVAEKSPGWHVVTKDGEVVTKAFRKDDLAEFDALSDEDKAAFVELHKPE